MTTTDNRATVPANRAWATIVGYSRAVRAGDRVEVSGTGPMGRDGAVVAPGDPYAQTVYVLEVIRAALAELGAELEDVIRTRVYLLDMGHWEQVGRAHNELFGQIQPACTFIGAGSFLHPEFLVEIEASAVIAASR